MTRTETLPQSDDAFPVPIPDPAARSTPTGVVSGVLRTATGRLGVALGAVVSAVIVLGRFLTPHDPQEINLAPPYSPPTGEFLLGTDGLGRDVLSRILVGGELVLLIPLIAVAIGVVLGGGVGAVAAYTGGRFDAVASRIVDLLISLPALLIALVAVAALDASFWVLVLVLIVADAPRAARTMRAAVAAQVSLEYVDAARARGERMFSILAREIGPNVVAPLASDIALRMTYGIIAIATLSFLGLGVQPPTPDWGLMINENRGGLFFSPLAVLAPAAMIALMSVSFNLIAEAITLHVTGESRKVSR